MDPVEGAAEAFQRLSQVLDIYILSTAPWNNSSAWHDKHVWVKKYLGPAAEKRLILSHHKHLNRGDFLIDDRPHKNGAGQFQGELLHFGPGNRFERWKEVVEYLGEKA